MRDLVPNATVIPGGATRQESVRNALAAVDTEHVVVHDAARPLASSRLVGDTLEALAACDGAVPGVPLDDTIKAVAAGRVDRTIDRSGIWRIQTPQSFRTAALVEAHERAVSEDFVATDDAQLLERYGMSVAVVEGDVMNMKITTREDFKIAEALLGSL